MRDLEALTRRVYELHRGQGWDALSEARRSALIAAYWRARSQYEAGRTEPREVRIWFRDEESNPR